LIFGLKRGFIKEKYYEDGKKEGTKALYRKNTNSMIKTFLGQLIEDVK